ncbi:DUF805 domain-containing protein [Paramuribaculum intestinale]|uniref:DUF805 domain-containing protein n=1 Tax=Paramuribaculum intestinale TaxID=2094151 RepID=UPI0025B22FB6|nr:DUF805 domain-containing protein [Paramuribaculum intestinale]
MAEFNQAAPLGFVDAVKRVINKYAEFKGRASRAEFWWWMLGCAVVSVVLSILAAITGFKLFQMISGLFSLAVLVPTLAVSWRRLHDTGRAGGWWFINFIPAVGLIIFIVFCAAPSEPQPNRFGEVPAN